MNRFKNINLWIVAFIALVAASVFLPPLARCAQVAASDFPSATFDGKQTRILVALLNRYLLGSGNGTNSANIIFADGYGPEYTTNGTAKRAGIVLMNAGTSLVSTTAINGKSIVLANWQLTNGASSGGYLGLSTKINNTNFTLAAYTNTPAGVAVINAGATGFVGWSMIQTGP